MADRLLGLRIRIPPGAWMFVLCVLYSKDKNDKRHSQDNQDKEVMQSERKKKISPRAWMVVRRECCVCCQVQVCATG
jgi:hypothetical protein